MSATQKRVWPELIGKNADSVIKILQKESGFDNIEILRDSSPITFDFNPTRIRVFVDENKKITVEPRIG